MNELALPRRFENCTIGFWRIGAAAEAFNVAHEGPRHGA
jgi:hypothetical protein